jgi:hypothetical protein
MDFVCQDCAKETNGNRYGNAVLYFAGDEFPVCDECLIAFARERLQT